MERRGSRRRRGRGWVAALAAVVVAGGGWRSRAAAAGEEGVGRYNLPGKPPYLVAHYMQWYSTPWSVEGEGKKAVDGTAQSWSHWKWKGGEADHDPDRKGVEGRRDIASVVYPLIGVYDSGSRAVVRYHLATMKAAGVSGVTAIWYGPASDTDRRFPLLLEEAGKLGMGVAICYEEKLNFPPYRHPKDRGEVVRTAAEDLGYIVKTYGGNPAYLKRDGVPVIMQFNGYGKSDVGPGVLSAGEFGEVFKRVGEKVCYVRQNLDPAYHPMIQGAYVWWNQGDWPARFAKEAGKLRGEGKLGFFMTMVCPGFDDTGVWGWGSGPRKSKGYGVGVLKWTEGQALEGGPELVQMVTWNDFNESTCFEPTVQNGFRFVDEVERWWGERTGRPVDLSDNRVPFDEYKKACSAVERGEIPNPSALAGSQK